MSFLVVHAYAQLIEFEFYIARGNFDAMHKKVHSYPVAKTPLTIPVERICAAMDMACIWYWKKALCLQRSAATTCLLKRFGIPAELVIGAQLMPLRVHAWVEVDGRVVNDKPYTPEIFAVLDRC